jgi:hypothetical protein
MRITITLLFITTLVSTSNSWALDKNGKYAIKGVGNIPCLEFVKMVEQDNPQKFLFAGWLNGYMTAHNQHLTDTFDIVSWENIETMGTYLRSHCNKNPKLSFFQATTQMLSELYAQRIVEFVGAENLSSGKQSKKTYFQVIARVQKRLKELNFYDGEIDGRMTKKLTAAVDTFRSKQGIPQSDFLDQKVLHALLRSE